MVTIRTHGYETLADIQGDSHAHRGTSKGEHTQGCAANPAQ